MESLSRKNVPVQPQGPTGQASLLMGGIAALLASACCLGPLVLIVLGFSGAWISNLTALKPFRPLFIGAAFVALYFAWRRIYQAEQKCNPGDVCALPRVRTAYKTIFWVVVALVAIALGFPYVFPFLY